MQVTLFPIKIKDLVENYQDNGEYGVYGYNGKLNIRPKYQREFVYIENIFLLLLTFSVSTVYL